MDAQMKRGFFEVCVLKALEKNDSYGYQLMKEISMVIDVSESALYPVLKRLETVRCLTFYTVEHNGRLRKYYQITEEGRKRIHDFVEEWKEVMKVYHFITSSQGGTQP